MATPKKLPSGNWRVQVFSHKENGKSKYVSFTAPTKAEAQRLAAEFQTSSRLKPVDYSAREAVERYIELKKDVLSPSTIDGYNKMLKNYDYFGRMPISKLTDADMQSFINHLSIDKSAKTVKNICTPLKTAITFFLHKQFYVTLPKKKPFLKKTPIKDDVIELMRLSDRDMKICIALASTASLRRGEICGLKYKDIDYSTNTIYVHTAVVKSPDDGWIHKDMPKNVTSIRHERVNQQIIDLIGSGNDEDFIVSLTPGAISDRFRRLKSRVGVDCRFHDLRGHSASVMHFLGFPDAYAQARGGWKTDYVMKNSYVRPLDDEENKFVDKALDYFDSYFD